MLCDTDRVLDGSLICLRWPWGHTTWYHTQGDPQHSCKVTSCIAMDTHSFGSSMNIFEQQWVTEDVHC